MIGLIRHDGFVTWMDEETFRTTRTYSQYKAVIRIKTLKIGKD